MPVNVPPTIYTPPSPGLGEMTSPGVTAITDTHNSVITDTLGSPITDTGQLFTNIPLTVYNEDDSQ